MESPYEPKKLSEEKERDTPQIPSAPTPQPSYSGHNPPVTAAPTSAPAAATPAFATPTNASELLHELLKGMVERKASDMHLRSGTVPIYRIDGNLSSAMKLVITPEMAHQALGQMLTPTQLKIFEARNDIDFSYALPAYGRFRGNAFRQRGSVAIVLRQIPTHIPNFTDLYLPKVMPKFCQLSRGLVLVCGVTGSGKSTTLAAMIDNINSERAEHIVTVEDPIEFLYKDKKSILSQRELGSDTPNFGEALKHVLRQDPDVILLGEMRDLETTSTAITAAQTGHLVLSTLHTTDAVQTINRIIDLYPPHQQMQVRYQLADVLKGVICQRLIPRAAGSGRVPAVEVLVVTALVRKAIAENQMHDVQEAIRQGTYYGMESFHQSLLKLYRDGLIKLEDALEAASNPEELMMAVRGITSGTDAA